MVDSTPTRAGPPSRPRSTSEPRSARTCSARVGLTRPKRLALGAATPPSNARSTASATGCPGTRSATVSCPPVTASEAREERRSTSVSGPGQNAEASRNASGGTWDAQDSMDDACATWTMSGWVDGRPFTAKMRRTASSFSASAASPYTVSVGRPTSPPRRSTATAAAIVSGEVTSMGSGLAAVSPRS